MENVNQEEIMKLYQKFWATNENNAPEGEQPNPADIIEDESGSTPPEGQVIDAE